MESDDSLRIWKQKIIKSVGEESISMIMTLIPEMELIVGQNHVTKTDENVDPVEQHRLFVKTIQRFIGVFTEAGRPIVISLDDMQVICKYNMIRRKLFEI